MTKQAGDILKKAKGKSAQSHPSRYPQTITPTVWYYEDKRTLEFIAECRDPKTNEYHQTLRFRVLSRKLIASLKRQGLIR